jgi:uncharacterized membrane protein
MDRRWLIGGLIASVGLNLFLLGIGLAVAVQRRHVEAMTPPASVLQAAEQLDPQDQAAFRRMLRQEGRRIAPDLKAARGARRDAARRMSAPAYDRAAVAADLDRARAAETRARAELEGAVLTFAQDLDQDERIALARALRRGLDTNRRALRGERRAQPPLDDRHPTAAPRGGPGGPS